jgi:hypothetical protein
VGNYPRQRNVRLLGVFNSPVFTGSRIFGRTGNVLGYAIGNQTPWEGNTSFPILGQIAQDVFLQDDAGFAFPAGQLWIRTYTDTSGGTGYDTDTLWMAVPSSLPAGFTEVPWRNNRGGSGFGLRIGNAGYGTLSNFPYTSPFGDTSIANFASYSPQKCIRPTTGGIWMPTSTTVDVVFGSDFPYGPGCLNKIVTSASDGSPPPGPTPADTYFPLCVGYRNARIVLNLTAGDHTTGAGGNVYFRIDGTVNTVPVASLTFNGTFWTTTVDIGAVGLAAAGALKQVTLAVWRDAIGGWTWSGSSWAVYLSPRVDIPAPFNVLGSGLFAPGGIASGTVPGF